MHKIFGLAALALILAGCADPLRDVPRLGDVEMAEDAGQAGALPDPSGQEIRAEDAPKVDTSEAPRSGLLGFFRRQADAATATPEPSAPDLADTATDLNPSSTDEAQVTPAQTAPQPRRGLRGFFRTTPSDRPEQTEAPESQTETPETAEIPTLPASAALPVETPPSERAQETPPQSNAQPRRGLLGLLRANPRNDGEETAALAPQTERRLSDTPDPAPRRARIRGRNAPGPDAPDYQQVGPGVTLPYGEIARLCGVSAARLGQKSATYPERGRGYTLYDSAPNSTGLRSFYITGFDDGCARQFTAALVLFGEPATYEQIRYSPASNTQPVSATDRAYEKVKSRVCRVPNGQPCGNRMTRLAESTVFVSIYERFGSNPRWKNLLLHDGQVMALDIKSQ